jgi:hypothetical protein
MSYLGASLDTIGLRFGGGFLLCAPAAPPRPTRKSCAVTGAISQQDRALRLARLMHFHNGAY